MGGEAMKEYLSGKIGERIGVVRSAVSKEAYFEATLVQVTETTAVFKDEQGREFATPLSSITMAGAAECLSEQLGKKAGFY